jgi:hypothetical protein
MVPSSRQQLTPSTDMFKLAISFSRYYDDVGHANCMQKRHHQVVAHENVRGNELFPSAPHEVKY